MGAIDDSQFDWTGEDVVIQSVSAVAVYRNPRGDIVIRQEGVHGDDDSFVVIPKQYVASVIEAIRSEVEQ